MLKATSQAMANADEPRAKRLRIEDEVATLAFPEPHAELQTPVKEFQRTPLDHQAETPTQLAVSDVTHPSPTMDTSSDKLKSIQIDPHGDAEISVQDSNDDEIHTAFSVCSRTLARVSPLWESFFFSSDSEHFQNLHCTIVETREKTWTFEIILHILHHNTSKIPARLNLAHLLVFFDMGRKCQIRSPLLFWGVRWFNSPSSPSDPKYRPVVLLTCRMWLANELGLSEIFHESMRDVAAKLQINGDQNLGFRTRKRFQKIKCTWLQDEECVGTSVALYRGETVEAAR